MKYRKKPVVIEAVEWTGKNEREMFNFLEGTESEFGRIMAYGKNFDIDHEKVQGGLIIKTLESEHISTSGDYIIKGVEGEFYPCKPSVFWMTYDYVDDGDVE